MECERGRISLSNETANYLLANGRPLAEREDAMRASICGMQQTICTPTNSAEIH